MPDNDSSITIVGKKFSDFKNTKCARTGAIIFIGLVIFALGVEIGNGQVRVALFATTTSQNQSLPETLNYASVSKVYDTLKQNYNGKLTTTQLLDGLKSGLADSANDPYTEYFNAGQAKAFDSELNNSFSGIGAELGKDSDGNLIVISPIKGFPAEKAGLKSQDIITMINNVSTSGMTADGAATKIRGPQGSTVTLKIVRNKSQTLTVMIRRDNIQLPSVTSKILAGNVGYMQISTFSNDTSMLSQKVAQQFKQAKVKGIILDLRGNPGGLLDAAVNVSSLWLPDGKTVVTEKGTGGSRTYSATGDNTLEGIPTVVLIDSGSASASEITAGALHDNGAARLIGAKSFGKGVVQQLIDLGDGSELKVTVASWYRPNGQNIQKKGIIPDQVVTVNDKDMAAHNDTQLTAAEAFFTK
jgi:carboxyl-terminal processing protease